MPSNLVWSWPLHLNSNISYVFMEKDGLNCKRGHAIIGFNHGLPCYVKNMALGPQSRQKPWPTASVFVYLSPSGHVFNIAWQAMIKTYSHYHWWHANWTLRNRQILIKILKLSLMKNFENVICKMATFLFQPQYIRCVNVFLSTFTQLTLNMLNYLKD